MGHRLEIGDIGRLGTDQFRDRLSAGLEVHSGFIALLETGNKKDHALDTPTRDLGGAGIEGIPGPLLQNRPIPPAIHGGVSKTKVKRRRDV